MPDIQIAKLPVVSKTERGILERSAQKLKVHSFLTYCTPIEKRTPSILPFMYPAGLKCGGYAMQPPPTQRSLFFTIRDILFLSDYLVKSFFHDIISPWIFLSARIPPHPWLVQLLKTTICIWKVSSLKFKNKLSQIQLKTNTQHKSVFKN